MVVLEYLSGGHWIVCGEFNSENLAWISLGGDDENYRTVGPTGKILTDKSKLTTAAEISIVSDVRFNHVRHLAASFIRKVNAYHLERELVDFLMQIDRAHEEELRVLRLRLTELGK